MSAEVLREAAELIGVDHPTCGCGLDDCPTRFYTAVALLLENEANAQEAAAGFDGVFAYNTSRAALLLDVARAYLGDPS